MDGLHSMAVETLITLPPLMAEFLNAAPEAARMRERLAWPRGSHVFATSDPRKKRLGSGGGTVHVLFRAWQASGEPELDAWLAASKKLILHAGGESRRLPAYAAIGKAFLPLPHLPGLKAQRFDQMLCDFQIPAYSQVLEETGPVPVAMVTSGDVWLDFDPLAVSPVNADAAGIGMRVSAEVAQHFGVFFADALTSGRAQERAIAFFLQKPRPGEILTRAKQFQFFVDTGMWLLSAKAIRFLFAQCGWDGTRFDTPDGLPLELDLYTDVGTMLGRPDTPFTSSVIALEEAVFHHLGSNRQVFQSLYSIQTEALSTQRRFILAGPTSACVCDLHRPVWADGVLPEQPVTARGANLLTGLPPRSRIETVPENLCVDVSPVDEDRFCLRIYHLDDPTRGAPGLIGGIDSHTWLERHGFAPSIADVFHLPIYPVLREEEITQDWVDWFVAENPPRKSAPEFLSAAEIPSRVNLSRYFTQRRQGAIQAMSESFKTSLKSDAGISFDHDFRAMADAILEEAPSLKSWILEHAQEMGEGLFKVEQRARFTRFLERLGAAGDAFEVMRGGVLQRHNTVKPMPELNLKEDQIVWARSPLRLDLAGGWTDTPPYCFESGGCVVNVAVTLNGQHPVQVFVRHAPARQILVRSIDLGSTEVITTWEQLGAFRSADASFSLAKAALALAGFHPEFSRNMPFSSLEAQLDAFGGGLELTLLCAVPKGSGLGTSSILAATLLGGLNRACNLGWDTVELYQQVLALEQLLTTGGGWQDQAGALFPGIKLIETQPGPAQSPSVRFLPSQLVADAAASQRWLLYYTGITRLAKNILAEIVTDMFLGAQETQVILDFIRRNALCAFDAIQTGDEQAVNRAIARSWRLNRMLDAGTSTPEIEAILAQCGQNLAGAKLLGAGGGGYMLLCAQDEESGRRIRQELETNPPNPRARFVDFMVADRGLEVTVS